MDIHGGSNSPLLLAVRDMHSELFLPLLTAHFQHFQSSSSSSVVVPNLLDQECTWWDHERKYLKLQSVRKWAKHWEEKGDGWSRSVEFYKGISQLLDSAEKRGIGIGLMKNVTPQTGKFTEIC